MKEKGLKVEVVFVHSRFQFEVWLSGYNRSCQSRYYDLLKGKCIPFELTGNPAREDYILRAALEESTDLSEGSLLISEIKRISNELLIFAETL